MGGGHVFRAERRPSPVLFAVRVSYRAHTPAQRERREPFPGLSLFVKTKLPARSGKHWECGTIQPSPPRVPLLNAPVCGRCGRRRPRNGKHLTDHRNTRYLELSAAASPLRVVLGGPCGRLPGRERESGGEWSLLLFLVGPVGGRWEERERVVESGPFFCIDGVNECPIVNAASLLGHRVRTGWHEHAFLPPTDHHTHTHTHTGTHRPGTQLLCEHGSRGPTCIARGMRRVVGTINGMRGLFLLPMN